MVNYLGNASLSPAVKERVLSTFQQVLTLYKQGRHDEVIQGCGLILRMDPQFDPAKKLLEKTRNPSAAIDVDALLPAPPRDPMAEARAAMAARDFQRVVSITAEVLTNDLLNDDARVLNEEAREKMEAAPFVEQFVRKFDQQLSAGNTNAAKAELEKARSLDPDHPAIARMEKALPAAAPAPGPAAAAAPAPAPPASSFTFDSPSFVVDTPSPATGRGTAQASDFGFTFEEEKQPEPAAPSGFSFDTPAQEGGGFAGFSFNTPATTSSDPLASFTPSQPSAPTPAPAAPPAEGPQTFDFSSASVETSDDDQKKIAQYLAEGDRALDGGDYQKAIDLWSRIFLIDVTNDEASQRIEKAKAKRREIEQRLEGIVAAGMAAYDKRDYDTARAKFNEVLRLDPGNDTATDYLGRIPESGAAEAGAKVTPFVPPSPPPAREKIDLFADDDFGSTDTLVPPEPVAIPTPAETKKKEKEKEKARPAATTTKKSPMGLVIVALAVVVLGAGGWFVWQKFMAKPAIDAAATQATFAQASALAKSGKYDQAIALLKDVKPNDPQHDRALMMIADLQKKKAQTAEMIGGRPAAAVWQENVTAGQQAFAAHDYDAAKKAFDAAARIKPLPPDVGPLADQATQQVAKLDAAKSLFREQKYADAIASLQALLAADPQNRSTQRMITDAHFNLGAQALQDERSDRTGEAIKEFDEVLKADPNDELAKRSRALAERYNGQTKDLLYKIYVRYLPLRNE